MKLKNIKNIRPGDLKLGEGDAEHVVVLVCTYVQLQIVFMLQLYLQHDFIT
jgi:hypothetical protein